MKNVRVLGYALVLASFIAFQGMARAGTLTDLGYPNGLTLTGSCPSQTVYFPLPAPASGAMLNLRFRASAALDPQSSLTISSNGVPVATVMDNAATAIFPISIPARFTQGQYLDLSFTAAQAISGDPQCYDDDGANPALWTEIDPATALSPNVTALQRPGGAGLGGAWRSLGAPLGIALPASPTFGDIQTALSLATALVERGIAPFFTGNPKTAAIIINPAAPLSLTGVSQINVPNPGAARALLAAGAAMQNVQASSATAAFAANPALGSNHVSFGALGIPSTTVTAGRDTILNLTLPLAQLPAGRHASALILYGTGAALPPGETEIITLEFGGDVVWSQAFTAAPVLDGVHIDLPDRLISSGARMDLRFIRIAADQSQRHFIGLPFTLRDSTSLQLAATSAAPRVFAAFTAASGLLTVITDLPAASLPPSLPLLAELLGAAGANPLAITISTPGAAPTTPFILVSHSAGNIVSIAPIPTPSANVPLLLPDQEAVVSLPAANTASSILQLVSAGSAASRVPGLWLSPGPPATLAQAALPGDGNVAFYDGSPTPATFDTELHDAIFTPAPAGTLNMLLRNWNTELFGAFWLLLTVMLVNIFVTRRRRAT